MEDNTTEHEKMLASIANIAEFANAIASLVVGHRKILVEGNFDVNLADSMAASLHASLLGLVPAWESDDGEVFIEVIHSEDEDDE